jgi:hypothetical protein
MKTPVAVVLLLVWSTLAAGLAVAADKTDTVQLKNGNVLTGEIKSLERGQLTYKTDMMETATIKWGWVTQLLSSNVFLVTLDGGEQYFGQLRAGASGRTLRVSAEGEDHDVPLDRVVRIKEIETGFWERIDLSLNLGFSYTQASQVSQFTFDGRTSYRDRVRFAELSLNTIFTETGEDSASARRSGQLDLTGKYQRMITGRLFAATQAAGQSNDELGLELRVSGTLGAGYMLIEQNSSRLSAGAGLSVNREWSTEGEPPTENVEAVISSGYSLFYYETPETDLQLSGELYRSLNQDRLRAEFDASLRRELITDFFITLTYYESYDSDPPAGSESNSDRGVVLKIGWSK